MREFRVQDPGLYDAENRSETELEGENELITPLLPRQWPASSPSTALPGLRQDTLKTPSLLR